MKSKYYLLMLAVAAASFFSSCNNNGGKDDHGHLNPLCSTGNAIQDSVLDKRLFRLVHNTSPYGSYFVYYYTNTLLVDSTHNPPKLTLTAQTVRYDSLNSASVLRNSSTSSQASSSVSVSTDTAAATYIGPFDPNNGQFYTSKGYLHYVNLSTFGDSTLCPVTRIVYWNQSGKGQPIGIGFVAQTDLH
jgi:hypothetical protein